MKQCRKPAPPLAWMFLILAGTLLSCADKSQNERPGEDAGPGGTGGNADSGVTTSPSPQEPNYRPCGRADMVGRFALTMKVQGEQSFTGFGGSVRDTRDPLSTLEVVQTVGACRLLKAKIPQCVQPCEADKVCGPGGVCMRFPTNQDVGAVRVSGLTQTVSVSASGTKLYSNDGVIPYPGVTEGADVTLEAEGGIYRPFSLIAKGIKPLEVTSGQVVVRRGAPVTLSWRAPSIMTGARIHVLLSLDNHGTSAQQVECDAPDTGQLEIATQLTDALASLGASGFPTLTLARRSVESTSIPPGCVEFNVLAQTTLEIEVAGITSCKTNADCPQGKVCDTTKQICQ